MFRADTPCCGGAPVFIAVTPSGCCLAVSIGRAITVGVSRVLYYHIRERCVFLFVKFVVHMCFHFRKSSVMFREFHRVIVLSVTENSLISVFSICVGDTEISFHSSCSREFKSYISCRSCPFFCLIFTFCIFIRCRS